VRWISLRGVGGEFMPELRGFPTLLTIVNFFCLYQVYNNETFFIVISFPWFKFDLSGER
jgi:hypothetical protein